MAKSRDKNQKAQQQQARKQRRNEKRRKRQDRGATRVPVSVRIKQRLAKQAPEAWDGENAVDSAVFDTTALNGLAPELQTQVVAVRDALVLVCAAQATEAAARVAEIPRSSPLSEWRLLIRGLTSWLDNDLPAAKEVWNRLDTTRRPGRIATAIIAAQLTNLDVISLDRGGASPAVTNDAGPADVSLLTEAGVKNRLDASLLQSAKLLRRVRIDRAAIRIARTGSSQPDEDSDLLIGPAKMKWLREFSLDFEDTEPQLVQALQQTALSRAYHQNFTDLFAVAVGYFKGPVHDRRSELLSFFYYSGSSSGESVANRYFLNYVDMDLKNNERLSGPLRQAMASECYHRRAALMMQAAEEVPSYLRHDARDDEKEIERLLKKATSAYPANRDAIRTHVDWVKSQLDNERLTAAEREPLEKKLSTVMKSWADSIPDDVEPRLWLVNHLLDNNELDEAQPFIEWLEVARQDDPRIRALPWKWQVLDMMRLCRRKTEFPKIPGKMLVVESTWPTWLSKDWLPYLRAAFLLRAGDATACEQQRILICEQQNIVRDSPRDACMMLAAAQGMNVAAADLKPLRVVVDAAVNGVAKIPTDDLLALGEFFWDLHRIQIVYPAYRMHGSKFGRELIKRINAEGSKVTRRVSQPAFQHAILWASEHRFWPNNDDLKFPKCLERCAATEPLIAAARISAILQFRNLRAINDARAGLELLRTAATTERDSFYRFWFASLVERTDRAVEKLSEKRFGFRGMMGAMAKAFGFGTDDDEDGGFEDEDDDEDDIDSECNCQDCVAERAAAEKRAVPNPIDEFTRRLF